MFLGDISRDPAVKIQWCLETKDPQNSKPFKTHGFPNEIHSMWTAFGPWSYLLRNPATAEMGGLDLALLSARSHPKMVELCRLQLRISGGIPKIWKNLSFRNDIYEYMSFNKRKLVAKDHKVETLQRYGFQLLVFWRLVGGLILSLFMGNLWPLRSPKWN